MKGIIATLALSVGLATAQPASAALMTVNFDGVIGPFTTPATLAGGEFDGTITFDNAGPFAKQPATLTVTNGPLADMYSFSTGKYLATFNDDVFRFQGTSNDGASLQFNFSDAGSGAYKGTFSFAKGSEFAAVGNATIGDVGVAPEASTWLMLIVGFGFTGIALRRRSAGWAHIVS